jgi:peptidoglycan/xylan/chitin deacetylase (PgdA/CDA1 family)
MSVRKQDLAVLLLYSLGFSRIRNLVFRLQGTAVTTFIAFHDIAPKAVEGFENNLRFLKQRTNVVSLDDYFSGRLSADLVNVVITFDDGYKSWVTRAAPALKKIGLPASFFIASGFVGLSKSDESEFLRSRLLLTPDPERSLAGLSVEDVRKLAEDGFTIGGHTVSHANLGNVTERSEIQDEIATDKRNLERMTGTTIAYFAYPFGAHHNPAVNLTEVLRTTGYSGAVTTISGFNVPGADPYLLHRELTPASMAGSVFRARTFGNYDAVRFVKRQIGKES